MYRQSPFPDLWPWLPGRKPTPPHVVEFNPYAPMSQGLVSLVLMDNTLTAPGWHDYANKGQAFTFNGAVGPAIASSPFGGQAFSNTVSGGTTDVLYSSTLALQSNWSVSALVQFNGSKPTSGSPTVIASDQAFTHCFAVDDVTGQWFDFANGGAGKFGSAVTAYSTWTRIHGTYDGTTATIYISGASNGSNAQAFSCSPGLLGYNWNNWPVADYFFWTRTLDASQVAAHAANPYGTTMRARMPATPRVIAKPPYQPNYNNGPMMSA